MEDDEQGREEEGEEEMMSNTEPVQFLPAVTRVWYRERGLATPDGKWITYSEGDKVFDYRLEQGIFELDVVLEYAAET
jgi:hypothetical protein